MEASGYRILDRNWRHGRCELDLVASKGGVVSFIEVKTRHGGAQVASEALPPAQRRRLRRAAEAWIHAHPGVGREFRFDMVAIDLTAGGPTFFDHVEDAFHGEDARPARRPIWRG